VPCAAGHAGHVPVDQHVHTYVHCSGQVVAALFHSSPAHQIHPYRAPHANPHQCPSGCRTHLWRVVTGVRPLPTTGEFTP
jgi:hypothetical protein